LARFGTIWHDLVWVAHKEQKNFPAIISGNPAEETWRCSSMAHPLPDISNLRFLSPLYRNGRICFYAAVIRAKAESTIIQGMPVRQEALAPKAPIKPGAWLFAAGRPHRHAPDPTGSREARRHISASLLAHSLFLPRIGIGGIA
jgi:hypothetical protein